ncbi:hypothetical protein B0T16DRAFT_495573 [Cercophora newfieldiana]|uniref:Uncharacterized protein n=1 Tax=Cercophora newfieldiana TaxID=92897 RepID=A0AA40CKE6_9PEZI|nr:hypothetical protein B0T16DRAFT_495573 [Cercophora newfieldiana]
MFSTVTDGSRPQASIYGAYFGGQLIGIFTAVVLEGLRRGNKNTALAKSALWGCAMQATGFGFTMPIYAIVHLLTSRTAGPRSPALSEDVRMSDLHMVRALPAAMFFGYVIPAILMAVPIPWNKLHQWLGGLWQGFPVWVVLIQYLIASRHRRR